MDSFVERKIIFTIAKLFFHNKIKPMKPYNTPYAFILGILTLFLIPSANSADCGSNTQENAEIECLSHDQRSIDAKEKELPFKVEV